MSHFPQKIIHNSIQAVNSRQVFCNLILYLIIGDVSNNSSLDPNVVQAFLNQRLLENSFEKQFGTLNRLSNDINMSLWLEQLTRATQVQFTYFNMFS